MKVPFIDLTREWAFFEERFLARFKEFGASGKYVLGPYTETFEKKFAEMCGYTYAVGISTGLSALETALLAQGVGAGDEVITVANSAVATSLAISYVGAQPVFCDIGNDFLIDPTKIEALITSKTKAILPVHLFGKVCDMEAIGAIAKKYSLAIVEDACQAHGAVFSGPSAVHTKAFSFYPTKNVGAMGEGGMVVTNDVQVRDFAISYRNYGQRERYNHIMKGTNYRIDALQCALMEIKLSDLPEFIAKRQAIAKRYHEALASIAQIILPDFDAKSAYHLFVIRVQNNKRTELQSFLQQRDIETLVHYPTAIHRQPCYAAEYSGLVLPVTDQFQAEILSLPCYPFLTSQEQEEIIAGIKTFFGSTL